MQEGPADMVQETSRAEGVPETDMAARGASSEESRSPDDPIDGSGAQDVDETTSLDEDEEGSAAATTDAAVALRADLDAARAEAQRLDDLFRRARADYENLLKRTERERDDIRRMSVARVVESFLEPVEILERALSDFESDGEDPRVLGIQMATRALRETLERHGLETVPGVGAAFDHNVHEAIAREPAEAPEGTVIQVVRSGYRLDGRLLRPALVKVSAGPA